MVLIKWPDTWLKDQGHYFFMVSQLRFGTQETCSCEERTRNQNPHMLGGELAHARKANPHRMKWELTHATRETHIWGLGGVVHPWPSRSEAALPTEEPLVLYRDLKWASTRRYQTTTYPLLKDKKRRNRRIQTPLTTTTQLAEQFHFQGY